MSTSTDRTADPAVRVDSTWAENVREQALRHTMFEWAPGQALIEPLVITKGEGSYFYDSSGKRYLDFSSQYMNVNIGHGHPAIGEAVSRQMSELPYIAGKMATSIRARLGAKLAEIAPGDINKAYFTLGGSDAVEAAIKIARLITGRRKVLTRFRSYHGSTYAALGVSGDRSRSIFEGAFTDNVVRVEDPYCFRCPWSKRLSSCDRECISHIERVIELEGPETIAAILMEGASGGSGVFTYPPEYWRRLREIADRHGIVLIDDEVVSGFGRTGTWFAVDHVGVVPDIIVAAKGLTSGYLPLGAVLVTDAIASHFDERSFPLGLTAQSHPVSLAAALANIQVIENEGLLDNVTRMGEHLGVRCAELKSAHPSVGDIRRTGLLGAIELVRDRATGEPLVSAASEGTNIMKALYERLLSRGLYTMTPPDMILMAPPLNVTESQIDEGIEVISEALTLADDLTRP